MAHIARLLDHGTALKTTRLGRTGLARRAVVEGRPFIDRVTEDMCPARLLLPRQMGHSVSDLCTERDFNIRLLKAIEPATCASQPAAR